MSEFELNKLPSIAEYIENSLRNAGFVDNPPGITKIRQTLALVEETGEFAGAARRYLGMARRSGTFEEMASELADVVITAFITAVVFEIDLCKEIESKLHIIFNRGWREPRPRLSDLLPPVNLG